MTELARIVWRYLGDGAASFFRFACRHPHERAPAGIKDGFVQAAFGSGPIGEIRARLFVLLWLWASHHVRDLEIFKDEGAIGIDKPT